MSALENMAICNKTTNKLKDWHYKLEKKMPAPAIYYIFLNACKKDDCIIFYEEEKLEIAKKFQEEVKSVFPHSVMVLNDLTQRENIYAT